MPRDLVSPDRRCAIFFFEGWVGVQPTLINLARSLSDAGYAVTIYGTPTTYPDPGNLGAGVEVRYLEPGLLSRIVEKLAALPRLGRLAAIRRRLMPWDFAFHGCREELLKSRRSRGPTVYIGVDGRGTMAASLSALILQRSYAFLSLELRLTEKERTGLRGVLGRWAFRRAACVIVQGQDRLDVLQRQLRWKHDKVFQLPNGPLPARETEAPSSESNFLRSRLGISPGTRIALAAGMIDDATCSPELTKGFASLSGWALVFHERHRRAPDEPYLVRLRAINPRNLYLSLEPVAYEDIEQIYSAADVGLAFYRPAGPTDDNFSQISSSGKLPHYLQQGKPILCSKLPYMVKLIEEFECGVVIEDPSDAAELARALDRISSRYREFSRNARTCYEARFDFSKGARRLIGFFDQL